MARIVTWHPVCRRSDLPANRGWPVTVDGRRLVIFGEGSDVYAVDNACRHLGAPLDDGFVENGCLTCPWHGWMYDLRTGDHVTFMTRRPGLQTYKVLVEGDQIVVDVD